MATGFQPFHRFKLPLIIIGSLVAIAGIGLVTIHFMKQFTPVKITESTTQVQAEKTPQQRADELLAKGDFEGAKAQYEIALKEYESSKNAAGVQDVKMQLQIVEATAKAEPLPQNTDRNRVVMGSQAQQ